jgi:hypothetical protein
MLIKAAYLAHKTTGRVAVSLVFTRLASDSYEKKKGGLLSPDKKTAALLFFFTPKNPQEQPQRPSASRAQPRSAPR